MASREVARKRAVVAGIALVGLGWAAFGIFLMSLFISDVRIAMSWPSYTATVETLGDPRGGRGGPYFPAMLRVQLADGSILSHWAERDVERPSRASWAQPLRDPQIGDRVAVHVAPTAPYRIIPASRLVGLGFAAFVLLVFLIAPFVLMRLVPDLWRAASEPAGALSDKRDRSRPPARVSPGKRKRRRRR